MKHLAGVLILAIFAPLLAAASEPMAAPALPPITLESFAKQPYMEDPSLSPNGEWIATRLAVQGQQTLAMIPLFDKAAPPTLIKLDASKLSVDWWRWVNDDWLLVGVSANDNVEGDKWRLSRVISIQRGTGKINLLGWKGAAQNAGDVIWVAKDGTPRILLGIQNSIYSNLPEFWPEVSEFDVSTGKSKIVINRRDNISDYYADGAGNVRLGYGYIAESRTAKLLYRASGKGSFTELDRANLKKDEKLSFPSLFLPEPDKALTTDNGDGFLAVYELDLATLRQGRKVFGDSEHDIAGLIDNAAGDGISGVRLLRDRSSVHWIDPAMAQTQTDLDKAVGAGQAEIVSWDQSRNGLLVHVGGADQAGAYFYYNRAAGGSMSRIGFVDEGFKSRKLSPVSTIRYKARDGLEMSAVLTLPKAREAKNLPLILLTHGGPQSRDHERWDWWVQFLAWRGYAVIQPNYRGSTGFGKAFFERGYGEWGLKMQDDLNDAVSHLAKQGIADPKRVCIIGASYGGYAAMRGAQRDGGQFRCAVSYAGVSDLAALARYDRRSLFGREYGADLKEKAPDFAAVSPLHFAPEFSAPILLIHGKDDLRVPVAQSRNMAAKLKAAGQDHRYIEQPLGDHHFSRQEDRLQFLREMDSFLAKHNPAG